MYSNPVSIRLLSARRTTTRPTARTLPHKVYCNGGSNSTSCDGFARIADQGGTLFGFNTLLMHPDQKLEIPIEPKAIHDEMNAAAFDEFGRMTANIGLEAVPATPNGQNIVLTPYVNPPTELIDATNLPKNQIGVKITPIATADGTQIWKITHNGVDTHPLHFHLYDVQVLNRVTWDNIIIPPDATELGWKDTVRTSPLEDTYVALRPLIPALPFELPNSIRPLHPAMPDRGRRWASTISMPPESRPVRSVNQLVNFGWEYVWHCHILSHEEMDMMRPQVVAVPPLAPDDDLCGDDRGKRHGGPGLERQLDHRDGLRDPGGRRNGAGQTWTTIFSPLDQPNLHEVRNATVPVDPTQARPNTGWSRRTRSGMAVSS